MPENYRRFQAGPDPFGRIWQVEFRWLQTAISIRHADTVDVKFVLWTDGEERQERVLALPHAGLLELSQKERASAHRSLVPEAGRFHLKHMIEGRRGYGKSSGDAVSRRSGRRPHIFSSRYNFFWSLSRGRY